MSEVLHALGLFFGAVIGVTLGGAVSLVLLKFVLLPLAEWLWDL